MSKIITTATVEVCADGTLTRACARALNRAHKTGFSGSTPVVEVRAVLACMHVAVREVPAASLAGKDRAAHTREVSRSRKAQARRAARKAGPAAAA